MALDDLGTGAGGPPTVRVDEAGLLEVRWPNGRPEQFEVTTVVFEQLVDDCNGGRRALNVLAKIAAALGGITG